VGDVEITLPLVKYHTRDARNALIQGIAAWFNSSSPYPNNTQLQTYIRPEPPATPEYSNFTNVASIVQAIYSEQDATTGGSIDLQNLEVLLDWEIDSDGGAYQCADDAALAGDVLGVIAPIPGLGYLAVIGPAFSIACAALEANGEQECGRFTQYITGRGTSRVSCRQSIRESGIGDDEVMVFAIPFILSYEYYCTSSIQHCAQSTARLLLTCSCRS